MMAGQAKEFIGFRVSPTSKRRLEARARQEHRSLSNWIKEKLGLHDDEEGPVEPNQKVTPRRKAH